MSTCQCHGAKCATERAFVSPCGTRQDARRRHRRWAAPRGAGTILVLLASLKPLSTVSSILPKKAAGSASRQASSLSSFPEKSLFAQARRSFRGGLILDYFLRKFSAAARQPRRSFRGCGQIPDRSRAGKVRGGESPAATSKAEFPVAKFPALPAPGQSHWTASSQRARRAVVASTRGGGGGGGEPAAAATAASRRSR